MTLSPWVRKLVLTTHITASVGWLGAVVAFLALAVLGLTSQDQQMVRSAFLVMEPAAGSILVPLSFASLLTGVIQSLGGAWGLFRHYWVVFKLLINVAASIVLLLYMQTLRYVAGVAADPASDLALVRNPSPLLHGGAALLLLLVAVILSVYKPRALTPYGQRKERERQQLRQRALGSATPHGEV